MTENDAMNRNERLRAVLRGGDPGDLGGGEAGLTDEEALAMRRTMLSAIPEPRERFRLVPVFFAAAAAVLACVVGLGLWRAQNPPDQPVQRVETVLSAKPAPQAGPRVEPASKPSIEVAAISPPARLRPKRLRSSMQHPSAPDLPIEVASLAEPPTRQVQFSAPGGTRIIWLLTESSLESNHRPSAAEGD